MTEHRREPDPAGVGPGIVTAVVNGTARLRLGISARASRLAPDQIELLDGWIEAIDLWQAGSEVAVQFSTSTTIGLDSVTWRICGDTHDVMPDLSVAFARVGADADSVAVLARLGEEVQPATAGAWFHVGTDGVDAGWVLPDGATSDLLRAAELPAELLEWVERAGISELVMLEGSLGRDGFVGGTALVAPDGIRAEAAQAVFAVLGAEPASADLLVAVEELHAGSVWSTGWFVAGSGTVKAGLVVVEPSVELLIACAMATGADDAALARFGAATGSEVPQLIELESWATGPEVTLHYDVIGDVGDGDELDEWDDELDGDDELS